MNFQQLSKSLSPCEVLPEKQTINLFPPDWVVGNVAPDIADRQFPPLTILLLRHFLMDEMSSLAAARRSGPRRTICGKVQRNVVW